MDWIPASGFGVSNPTASLPLLWLPSASDVLFFAQWSPEQRLATVGDCDAGDVGRVPNISSRPFRPYCSAPLTHDTNQLQPPASRDMRRQSLVVASTTLPLSRLNWAGFRGLRVSGMER